MKLKSISFLIIALLLTGIFSSCGNDDDEYIASTLSADAQIYTFSARAKPITASDTANYTVLAYTKFVIDQQNSLIYNADSLPFGTNISKIAATMTFASGTPYARQIIYPDSISDWTAAADSIDFTLYDLYEGAHPEAKFKVTAQNGSNSKTYTFRMLIRQVDPEKIEWRLQSGALPNTSEYFKTLFVDGVFYHFTNTSTTLDLNTKGYDDVNWTVKSPSSLPTALKMESMSYLDGSFYVIGTDNNVYASSDGENFALKTVASPYTITTILGILPAKTEANADSLFVIANDGTKNVFGVTTDFTDLKIESANVDSEFPIESFSSVVYTKYNMLMVTGGKDSAGKYRNATWWIRGGNSGLEIGSADKNIPFLAESALVNFIYDDQLYVLSDGLMYLSLLGLNWSEAPDSQHNPDLESTGGQSIIVDNDNYIWIFGGYKSGGGYSNQVWKGRMNKFNPPIN